MILKTVYKWQNFIGVVKIFYVTESPVIVQMEFAVNVQDFWGVLKYKRT